MRAVLCGFAGTAPRSVTPNLIELLSILLPRCPGDNRKEISDILYAVCDHDYQSFRLLIISKNDFVPSKAGDDAKSKFIKAITG